MAILKPPKRPPSAEKPICFMLCVCALGGNGSASAVRGANSPQITAAKTHTCDEAPANCVHDNRANDNRANANGANESRANDSRANAMSITFSGRFLASSQDTG